MRTVVSWVFETVVLMIALLGAYGLLGTSLSRRLKATNVKFIQAGAGSRDPDWRDLSNPESLFRLITEYKPRIVINLTALSQVDSCESNPNRAYESNVAPLKILSNLRTYFDFSVIQISTDQVYSGAGPHMESEMARPLNVYGSTKLEAEAHLDHKRDLVLRTNFVGKSRSERKVSWTDWLIKEVRSGHQVQIRKDSWFNPLHIDQLCSVIISSAFMNIAGVYNLGSLGYATKILFARELSRRLFLDDSLLFETESSSNSSSAPRARDLRLQIDKFVNSTGIFLPSLESVIEQCVLDYKDKT